MGRKGGEAGTGETPILHKEKFLAHTSRDNERGHSLLEESLSKQDWQQM